MPPIPPAPAEPPVPVDPPVPVEPSAPVDHPVPFFPPDPGGPGEPWFDSRHDWRDRVSEIGVVDEIFSRDQLAELCAFAAANAWTPQNSKAWDLRRMFEKAREEWDLGPEDAEHTADLIEQEDGWDAVSREEFLAEFGGQPRPRHVDRRERKNEREGTDEAPHGERENDQPIIIDCPRKTDRRTVPKQNFRPKDKYNGTN